MLKKAIQLVTIFAILAMVVACEGVEQAVSEAVLPEIFVFPGDTELRLISEEQIPQDNCDGSAEMSQTLQREHTIIYTMELGSGIIVSADGRAKIPQVGEVGVGAEVASTYSVGYGREESLSRSVTVAAREGTNIQHTVRQYEVWEMGEVLVAAAGVNQKFSYSFRRDFKIETVPPATLGCPTGGSPLAEPTITDVVETPTPSIPLDAPTATPTIEARVEFVEMPVNNEQGQIWIAPETGLFSFGIESGAYNGWGTDLECSNAVPDRAGCWRTRLNAYIGCLINWQRPPHSPEMSEPMQPSFALGDLTYQENLQIAEQFAKGLTPYTTQLEKGDCIRFVAIDGFNPATGYSAYADNRGEEEKGNTMSIRVTGPLR